MTTEAFLPYGKLPDGKYGLRLENNTSVPLASVIEVVDTLPAVATPSNFPGRTVFERTTGSLYVFINDPTASWASLDGIPADIGNVNGTPPTSPVPPDGKLYYDLDTEVLFVWDSTAWRPVGGRYAAQFKQQIYTADGFDTTFSMGTTSIVTSSYVEVYLDGVRQTPNPGGDYDVVGTNIVFASAPPNGVRILIRALESNAVVQNAQMYQASYTADAGNTQFSVGVPGLDPAGVLVFKDGVLQTLSVDYTYNQQNTNITTLLKTSSTVARATTVHPHNLSIGFTVTLSGILENYYNNTTFVVTSTPTATQFEFTVLSSAPANGTPDPIMYFSPAYRNDLIEFVTPLTGGETIDIRAIKNAIIAPSTGEANTLASVGSGTDLTAGKAGTTLQMKSLKAGANVTIMSDSSEVTISVSNAGSYIDRIGISSPTYTVGPEGYVGVMNTSLPVTVSLANITGPTFSGRSIVVMDESGGAASNNITVSTGGNLIDGLHTTYVINTNYGCVSMVYNGSNWHIVSEKV